jgi:hypothetical protein
MLNFPDLARSKLVSLSCNMDPRDFTPSSPKFALANLEKSQKKTKLFHEFLISRAAFL